MKRLPDLKLAMMFGSMFFQCLFFMQQVKAVSKATVSSGNWNNTSLWSPSGIPAANDDVTIGAGHQVTIVNNQSVRALTVSSGASLTWSTSNKLTIGGTFTVNGMVIMNGGNIHLSTTNTPFILGANSSFTWDPGTNNAANATLFTNGAESFPPSSSLIIKKWYNYQVPIGSVVTGNFGNLTLNSLNPSNLIVEWNQNNYFQSHQVVGTLTVDQGWITLDKSGSISNTNVGNIVLTSMNSSFYGHNGNHNSSFSIITNNITNSGGIFYGLNDGTGNVTVRANANFTNIGNVKIINNSGVSGVCNGNATFQVGGTFSQNTGDTRVIYNVTTLNSGTFTATFGNLVLNGGIFMGQTGIHTAGGISTITVLNNFNVSFFNASDKFRGTSLSSIGTTMNNVKLNLNIGGNLSVSGISNAEFTSSASSGIETIMINGQVSTSGTTASFNYGTNAASHALQTTIGGNVTVNGGAVFFSRNGGSAAIAIGGNLSITSGNLSLKGDTGSANLQLAGNFSQDGGNFYLHYNTLIPADKSISMTVVGNFFQSGGILNFDNNSSSLSATHEINIAGVTYSLAGNGNITHAGSGTSNVFGQLNFIRNGSILFSRTSGNHYIQQVKQKIKSGCTLDVITGDIQVSSHADTLTDYFRIATGGIANMNAGHLVSNGLFLNSRMQVDSGGTIKTYLSNGFYDGTPEACLNALNNFNFYLHPYSVVEYNGANNQIVTGSGAGVATTTNHTYGILRINFNGDNDVEYVSPSSSNVFVRTKLELVRGELNLNGHTLTIESGIPNAVTRVTGYIKSEMNAAINASRFRWKNMSSGLHRFPFGVNAASYLPVDFSPTSGFGGDVTIATRATSTADNMPYPATSSPPPIDLMVNGINIATDQAVDRWWDISADGFTADVALTYRAEENTLSISNSVGPMSIIQWNVNRWNQQIGNGSAALSGTGRVTATGVNLFSNWLVIGHSNPLPIQLSSFMAKVKKNEVYLSWITAVEFNNDYFNVERSLDGYHFENLQKIQGAGNSNIMNSYGTVDKSPIHGVSYYRLKQTDFDGKFSYSETIAVDVQVIKSTDISILDFGPNPFDTNFWIMYQCAKADQVKVQLLTMTGELIYEEEATADEGYNKFECKLQAKVPQGIYLLNMIHHDKKITQKIIKK